MQYAPNENRPDEKQSSSFLGLKANGSVLIYTNGEANNVTPFVDIVDQFVIAQNYNLTYDLIYYRKTENGVPYIYLLAKYGTDITYTIMGKHESGFTLN